MLLTATPSPSSGQTFLPAPVDQATAALQLERPFLSDIDGLAAYSSILEVDAILPLGRTASLRLGLPVALAGADVLDGTSAYLGNFRASILFGEAGVAPSSFIGITLPTASNINGPDLAVLVGALPWLGESEKWMEDAFSLSGAVIPSWPAADGTQLGLRLGGTAILPTDFENLHIDARAAGWGHFPLASAELRGDLAMGYLVTSDDGFGRQFTAYFNLGARLPDMSGRPGLFVRVPLDGDGRRFVDFSVGLSAEF